MNRTRYHVDRGVVVPMRDGALLAADVYLPDGAGPWPTLLTRTPYGRGDVFQSQFILNMQFADAVADGFAVVVQDTRGRGGSTGQFTPFVDEESDAVDTLDWIVAQEFSDGRVSMFGASYVGATQWLAAVAGHSALVSIAPVLTAPDFRSEWVHPGGAFQLSFQLQWLLEALGDDDIAHRDWQDPRARDRAVETLRRLQTDPEGGFARVPLVDDALETLAPHLAHWLDHPDPDAQWARYDASSRLPVLPIPALHVLGWNDIFAAGALRAFERAIGPDAIVADRQYLVAGPWSHGNMSDWQGDRWHGYGASAQSVDVQGMQLEFVRAILEGREPALPRVRYFTSGTDEWATSEVWPLPGVRSQRWSLSAGGMLMTPGENATAGTDVFRSDPDDPVPSVGGPSFLPGILQGRNSGHKVQEEVERREDVMLYTSEPLPRDLHVVGVATVELHASCDKVSADWVVRLCDVDERGVSFGISDGIRRSRTMDSAASGAALRIDMTPTSHVFRAGHRVRLQVTGSNFPRFDVNPHGQVASARAQPEDREIALQTIAFGMDAPSCVVLPIRAEGE